MKVAFAVGNCDIRFSKVIVSALESIGIKVCVRNDFWASCLGGMKNVIAWNDWSFSLDGKNVLYVDNGLFAQKEGLLVDARGWLSDSNLCLNCYSELRGSDERISYICQKYFGWELFSGCDPHGPILYAIQANQPVDNYMPCMSNRGTLVSGLLFLSRYCKNKDIIVRPHPKFMKQWERVRSRLRKEGYSWEEDRSDSPYDILPKCSALVTINSTLATEALGLGMPVATLGLGSYSGYNVTLECAKTPSMLESLSCWEPKKENILKYLRGIMKHQISYSASEKDFLENEQVKIWLNSLSEIDCDIPGAVLQVSGGKRRKR